MKERFSRKRILFLIGTLLLFGLWTYLVVSKTPIIAAFDSSIQRAVFSLRREWLTKLVVPFSYFGNWQAQTIVCLIIIAIPKTRFSYGLPLTVSSLASVGFYQAVKYAVRRARPDLALHLLKQGGYSYVSGHSQTSFITWGIMILLLEYYFEHKGQSLPVYTQLPYFNKHPQPAQLFPRSKGILNLWRTLLVIFIVLMALSRIYVGVHWPSDIIGGWLLGLFVVICLDGLMLGQLLKNER